ncbi:MAG: hypothetical protein ACRDC6_08690 [Shewanella sp.]
MASISGGKTAIRNDLSTENKVFMAFNCYFPFINEESLLGLLYFFSWPMVWEIN